MFEIGKITVGRIDRKTNRGFFVTDEEGDEVFLPLSFAPLRSEIGSEIDVFVYLNTDGDRICTSELPLAQVGEYALMQVIETREFGAFFDWGIDKDLLVPGNEQKIKVRQYEDHIVRVCLEEGTDRVYGTTKLGKYIEQPKEDISEGDTVSLELVRKTDLGFKVIVNKKYLGMIYHNEIYSHMRIRDKASGIVKKIREDGLIDISLQKLGISNLIEAKAQVLKFLNDNDGKSDLHDKSPPEKIKHNLFMSKKTFKSAIGMLYREKKIIINKDGIELVK